LPGGRASADGAPSDAEFLAAVGRAVRLRREQRAMSRKVLARAADVSERYLAQLEAGEGNASIVLLRHVAAALGARINDLFDACDKDAGRRKRIVLIGLRGAGKSTLGQALAKSLGRPFVELDREIEREAGIGLSELFLLSGQEGFRRVERRCLERVIASHEDMVLTAGGGIVSDPETFNRLLANCYTVWIKAAPEEHMARVIAQGDTRPMAGNAEAMKDLRRILASRESLYGKADARIDTSGQSVQQSLAALRRAVRSVATNSL
jgi:XRE family aerobic/anaerobic benzoate catabolism transcriptional regulator